MNTDTRIQLYDISSKNTYNQRSMGTLSIESFNGDLGEMTPTGCPRSVDIPQLMAKVTKINNYRMQLQTRCFVMDTKKTSVYPIVEVEDLQDGCTRESEEHMQTPSRVHIKDHQFDSENRKKKYRRLKPSDVTGNIHAPVRGAKPIRSRFYKTDESTIIIMPTRKLGLE